MFRTLTGASRSDKPMHLSACLVAVLLCAFEAAAQDLQSPCPRLFIYEPRGTEPDRWYGILTLLSESDLSGVWLRLILDRPSLQLGNWFGEVVTEDNKEYLIKNRNHKLTANTPHTLRFYIKYNPGEPVPRLSGFRLNAKTVCPEGVSTTPAPTSVGQLITSSELMTTSSPMAAALPILPEAPPGGTLSRPGGSVFIPSSSSDDDDFFHGDFNPSGGSSNPISSAASGNKQDIECGTIAVRRKRQVSYMYSDQGQQQYNPYNNFYQYINSIVNSLSQRQVQPSPLISYGQPTKAGEYPWHAAMYHAKGVGLTYICGGSLISRFHVITVAHCVSAPRSQTTLDPDSLLIYLGKHYLKKWSSPGIQDHQVSRIVRHPEYNSRTYSNDIAIVKLQRSADFTDQVRPVCLWNGQMDFAQLVGKFGIVVGWGFDERGVLTEELTMVKMPIISKEACIYSFPDFFSRFTTSETFCAGFKNGTSVCNGDSGGGMVFSKPSSNPNKKVWQLRGLVSVSVALQNEFKCDPRHYVVFTDVAKYLDFIKRATSN